MLPTDMAGMCYVDGQFAHDIFVSYSHGDPLGAGRSPLKSWSIRCMEKLREDIHATDPEFDMLSIFMDQNLDATLQLTPQIRERVKGSGLLLIIMSPRYLTSAWCQDELDWFQTEVERRNHEDGYVFVVRALPTDEERWPICLRDEHGHVVLGFYFHPRPVDPESTRAFGWPDPQSSDREFYQALASLSGKIMRRLRQLRRREHLRRQGAQQEEIHTIGTPTLYLHAPPAHQAAWREVRRQLVSAGFVIRPEELKPVGASLTEVYAARRARLEAYRECNALVILRSEAGDWINAEIEATGHTERADLKAIYKKHLPCAVLDRIGGSIPAAARFSVRIVSGTNNDWLVGLRQWLASPSTLSAEVLT